jgi:hypothetical protein
MTTLVVETGVSIVGIFSVEDNNYIPYRWPDDIPVALQRIAAADELVTYNGENYDLRKLGEFAGSPGDFVLTGTHTDMRSICWSDLIAGSSLTKTYLMHFGEFPTFSDTYEGSNERDCYMTFKLWQRWKEGSLVVLDGHVDYRKVHAAEPSDADNSFFVPYRSRPF